MAPQEDLETCLSSLVFPCRFWKVANVTKTVFPPPDGMRRAAGEGKEGVLRSDKSQNLKASFRILENGKCGRGCHREVATGEPED